MYDYTHNKEPKDARLCQLIRKTITVNRKEIGLEFDDVAHELGLSPGTLSNKLKPAMPTSDLTLSEFMHFLSLTGDYAALEYIANKFDMVIIPKRKAHATLKDIYHFADTAMIRNSAVFKVVKVSLADEKITLDEQEDILHEIDEAQKGNAELRDAVMNLEIIEEE